MCVKSSSRKYTDEDERTTAAVALKGGKEAMVSANSDTCGVLPTVGRNG